MKSLVEEHFDQVATSYDKGKKKYSYYYDNLKKLLKRLIPSNKCVFEIGSGTGDLLAVLEPKFGYGIDISSQMVKIAKGKYRKKKNLIFSTQWPEGKFDYIFMSDVIEHLEKPEYMFGDILKLMDSQTVLINTMANPVWEPLLMFWEKMGWKMEEGKHKRIEYKSLKDMVERVGLKIVKHNYTLLVPIEIPFITKFANRYLEKLLKNYAFIEYFVATKK